MKVNYPLLALVIGAFGTGIAEFSPMSLLSVIARGADVSIPAVGMLIGTYVASVMVGTSLMALLFSHRAHRSALIFLIVVFMLGNVLSAIVPNYMTLMLSHTLASLDHGVFFGLGSVMAASVVPEHKRVSAVATMFMGLTLANIDGVPTAAWLGETIGWRMLSLATAGLGMILMVSLFFSLPKGGIGARSEAKKELVILMRPQVLSASLTTVLGAGAMFTLYTYISPVLQSTTHATSVFTMAMLALIGVGFSIDNYFGGKLVGRSVGGMLKGFLLLLMVITLAISFLTRDEFGAAISMTVWDVATSTVVPPLRMRMMRAISEAPGLSLSVNISAFNLGNVLGAAAGGAVISARLGYSFMPVMGAIVAGLALLLVSTSARKQPETVCVANS